MSDDEELKPLDRSFLEHAVKTPSQYDRTCRRMARQILDADRDLAALRARLATAEGLLERMVKYITEDRATTPGVTRLARCADEARAFLADSPATPAKGPPT